MSQIRGLQCDAPDLVVLAAVGAGETDLQLVIDVVHAVDLPGGDRRPALTDPLDCATERDRASAG